MKHFKLLLATLLAFVCTTGVWADEITLNGVTYALSDNATTATVIKIPSTDTSLTIPATITYNGTSYAVKYIRLYEVNSTLTDLTVEGQIDSFDGRTQSGSITNAFTSLKNLTFNQLVSAIYEQSFYMHPTLESVKFEGGVEVIGQLAFYSCHQLKTIDFGTRLSEIQQSAFYQCSSLEEVVFPTESWYVNINKHAFYYCPKLAHVVFPDDMRAYWDFNLGDECFTRSTENIVVKIPYGRADYFKKYFNSNANYEEYPSPVTFSVAAGRYEEVQTVEIANTWGTSIYYTTDGSDPLVNGQEYTGAITVDKTMVIRAYATRTPSPARPANWSTSPVVEAKYVIELEPVLESFSLIANMGRVDCIVGSGFEQLLDGGIINRTLTGGEQVKIQIFGNALRDGKIVGTLSHIYRDGVDIITQLTPYPIEQYGSLYIYDVTEAVDGQHPQFVLIYDPVAGADDMLTAALVPSNGQVLEFTDGGSATSSSARPEVVQFAKGSDLAITANNINSSIFKIHLYINGEDHVDDLEDGGSGKKVLHLQNVTEDILVEVKYELLKIDMATYSSKGGQSNVSYTMTDGVETSVGMSVDEFGRIYNMKPNTPVTFTFTPQEGYELGLVFYEYERPIGDNSDYEVQLQADGSYQFVLPAEQLVENDPYFIVFYKKIGADVNYDINGDHEVNVADVTELVNIILGN